MQARAVKIRRWHYAIIMPLWERLPHRQNARLLHAATNPL
jgi:hypothetical protein